MKRIVTCIFVAGAMFLNVDAFAGSNCGAKTGKCGAQNIKTRNGQDVKGAVCKAEMKAKKPCKTTCAEMKAKKQCKTACPLADKSKSGACKLPETEAAVTGEKTIEK